MEAEKLANESENKTIGQYKMKPTADLIGYGMLTERVWNLIVLYFSKINLTKNIKQLQYLNHVLFPVKYQDKYYKTLLLRHEFTEFGMIIN